jgi:hypothetical protein
LYTNDGENLIELCKPVLLNGITEFVNRADLANRTIVIELPRIAPEERKTAEQVDADFQRDLPLMLGVLMDGVAAAQRNKDSILLPRMPRMADVVVWCTAAEEGLGWDQGSFLRAFEANQLNLVLVNLANDPVATALRAFLVSYRKGRWEGSASELLQGLEGFRPETITSRSWPTTPAYLSQSISRLAPSLREVGIHFAGRNRSSTERVLIFEKLHTFMALHPETGGASSSDTAMPPRAAGEWDHLFPD